MLDLQTTVTSSPALLAISLLRTQQRSRAARVEERLVDLQQIVSGVAQLSAEAAEDAQDVQVRHMPGLELDAWYRHPCGELSVLFTPFGCDAKSPRAPMLRVGWTLGNSPVQL
jgi:hypothetical protein